MMKSIFTLTFLTLAAFGHTESPPPAFTSLIRPNDPSFTFEHIQKLLERVREKGRISKKPGPAIKGLRLTTQEIGDLTGRAVLNPRTTILLRLPEKPYQDGDWLRVSARQPRAWVRGVVQMNHQFQAGEILTGFYGKIPIFRHILTEASLAEMKVSRTMANKLPRWGPWGLPLMGPLFNRILRAAYGAAMLL